MIFTMERTAHPERRTAFETRVAELGRRHWRIRRGCPWQNGIIERSNRTDNEECFRTMRFTCSEHRRYQHRLWEMEYNTHRPHMGLGGQTPAAVFAAEYRWQACAYGIVS